MINYAIELEFFVAPIRVSSSKEEASIIPAYKVTSNLDGDPVVGEIRTGIFPNPVDLIFDLKKRIYLEEQHLASKGYEMVLSPEAKLSRDTILGLRSDRYYINKKTLEPLTELSIYGGRVGKILPRGIFKASLQINISDNSVITWRTENKAGQELKLETSVSNVFDYTSFIRKWDAAFAEDIAVAKRVRGVYALKAGTMGSRVEYRSLPNNIDIDRLMTVLSK